MTKKTSGPEIPTLFECHFGHFVSKQKHYQPITDHHQSAVLRRAALAIIDNIIIVDVVRGKLIK